MILFTDNDKRIIEANLDLPPRELLPMLEGSYTSRQVTAYKTYFRNRDRELQRQKTYRENNIEVMRQRCASWRNKNSNYDKERQKQWREKNHTHDIQRRRDYRAMLKKKYNIPDKYGGKGQALVRGLIEERLNLKCKEEHRFSWLTSKKGYVMPVDMFFEDIGLVVEFNGEQHYMPVQFGGSKEDAVLKFKRQRTRDRLKYSKILGKGLALLVVPYNYTLEWLYSSLDEIKESDAKWIEHD